MKLHRKISRYGSKQEDLLDANDSDDALLSTLSQSVQIRLPIKPVHDVDESYPKNSSAITS